ncbi:hypothetical protein AB0Y14_01115 [Rothia sp. HC945]|uniref:hypothetical protein n=1 Tax=Rothia sp. HC945 TaxID=3171170 RepID=UPI00264DBA18|nr:hypothetical protein [Kocuria sp.]MDN5617137.1 hypothetical protein [Kocuria sp.]
MTILPTRDLLALAAADASHHLVTWNIAGRRAWTSASGSWPAMPGNEQSERGVRSE